MGESSDRLCTADNIIFCRDIVVPVRTAFTTTNTGLWAMSRVSLMRKRRLSRRFGEGKDHHWLPRKEEPVVTWLGQPVLQHLRHSPHPLWVLSCSTTSMTQLATSTSAAATSPPLTSQPSFSDITTAAEPTMATTQLFFTADEAGVELRRPCPQGVRPRLLKECAAQLVKLLLLSSTWVLGLGEHQFCEKHHVLCSCSG